MSLVHNASSSGSPLAELSSGQLGIGGAEVEHVVRDGMPHGFYFFPGMCKQGDQAFAAIAAFLKRTGLA